ncbi:alpha/beta hydrolase [Mycobacterium sp. 1274761.0]|uniref:alpha/beta hydrolase n=1 Tax=Mycobacterium sp. 1274761.0 TaxID=1834077 RepID=UPI0007FB974D|nr:alpha/beta hydrolase [Mycobacterium sp. 1274761.0]OBK71872.1 esterase [Mycobacterium sp. 1274761.0]
MQTVEYAPGRRADLLGDPTQPTVLIWHGMQTDSRTAIRPLAQFVAEHGLSVIAADWNAHAADGGRDDLLQSLRFAQQRTSEGLTLVGWSMGGLAAAGLTVQAERHDVFLRHTVCLAGAFMATDPISGRSPAAELGNTDRRSFFSLLHGIGDDVVPLSASRQFGAELERHGWPVEVVELDADHGSIAGARYDSAADRYHAADDPGTLAVAKDVAARIAAVSR